MKTTIRILVATLACGGAFAAAAQTAGEPSEAVDRAAATQAEAKADEVDRFCLRETGSRIPMASRVSGKRDQRRCTGANGRVYTREEIERTGEVDLADALRRLDPSIH